MEKTFFILACEKSGDNHAANLVLELQKIYPTARFLGIGGPALRSTGFHALFNMEDFELFGFVDIIKNLPKIFSQFRAVKKAITSLNPDAVIFVDYPGFNLKMAKTLRKEGFKNKLIQYISPTVWAWKEGRIQTIETYFDLLLCIFPFEPPFYKNIECHFVGHPSPLPQLINEERKYLTLFPGSRKGEIEKNLPLMLKSAEKILAKHPELTLAVSWTDFAPQDNSLWMSRSKIALATCGTITFELALHDTPSVVIYKISPVNYFIARFIAHIKISLFCIVNILMQKEVFPEWIGLKINPDDVATSALKLLENPAPTLLECEKMRKLFEGKEASLEAAKRIQSCLP